MAGESALSSNIGSLMQLLPLFIGKNQTTSQDGGERVQVQEGGGTVSSSGSSSGGYGYEQTLLSQEALNRLMQTVMESNTGLSAIAQGQKNAGLYNTSTMQLLINDLMARAAGEVAVRGAKTEKVTPVSSSFSASSPASNRVTTTSTGTPQNTRVSTPALLGGNAGNALLASLLAKSLLPSGNKGSAESPLEKLKKLLGVGAGAEVERGLSWDNLTSNQSFDKLMGSLGIDVSSDALGGLSFTPSEVFSPQSIAGIDLSPLSLGLTDLGANSTSAASLFGIPDVPAFSLPSAEPLMNLFQLGSIDAPFANVDLSDAGGFLNTGISTDVVTDIPTDIPTDYDFDAATQEYLDYAGYSDGATSAIPLGSVVGGVLGGLANDGNLSVDEARSTAINTAGNYFTMGMYGLANTATGGALTETLAPVVEGVETVGFNALAATDPMFALLNGETGLTEQLFDIDTSIGSDFIKDLFGGIGDIFDNCFITTAVCGAMNLPDNCYELTTLRGFRDSWLTDNHPKDIEQYYKEAPTIVTKLKMREDAPVVFRSFYKHYIVPAVNAIEEGKHSEAYRIYKNLYDKAVELSTSGE